MTNTHLPSSPALTRLRQLEEENEKLKREVKQWKGHHSDMVKRAALLRDRKDLPLERVAAYHELVRLQTIVAQLESGEDLFSSRPTEATVSRPISNLGKSEVPHHYLQPYNRYHPAMGNVLWFHFPSFIETPEIMCGSPSQGNFDAQVWTHFTVFDFESILQQRMGRFAEAA